MNNGLLRIDIAEVIDHETTYSWLPNQLFALRVKSCNTYYNGDEYVVIPANNNIKKIPVKGEVVLTVRTFNSYSNSDSQFEQNFYLSSIDLLSSIDNNMVVDISAEHFNKPTPDQIKNTPGGKTYDKQNQINPLQPYEGDILFEGRFGNSIRFGSTITKIPNSYYHVTPTWTGNVDSDPIIILSNKRNRVNNREIIVEDINQDASSLYLTSTQKVPLKLNKTLSNNNFEGSQLLAVSDRIILSSKQNDVIVDANQQIILNTNNEIKLGSDQANSPIPHGDILEEILFNIIFAIAGGCTDSAGGNAIINGSTELQQAINLMKRLNSTKYKMDFT